MQIVKKQSLNLCVVTKKAACSVCDFVDKKEKKKQDSRSYVKECKKFEEWWHGQ
jgi:hypothetical protein